MIILQYETLTRTKSNNIKIIVSIVIMRTLNII